MPAIEIAVLKLNSLKRKSSDLNTIPKKQSISIDFSYQTENLFSGYLAIYISH
jgi:hypothetical protein